MKHALLLVGLVLSSSLASAAVLSPQQLAKKGLAAVVVVRAESKKGGAKEASGFFVDKDVIATLASVVKDAERVHVRLAGDDKWLEIGPVVAKDRGNDLILLKLVEKPAVRPIAIAKEPPSIGQTVYAIAVPPKTKGVLHKGLVSGLVENGGRTFVQMDAVVPEGAEGGVLLDEGGDCVGVLVKSQGGDPRFTYAVPGNVLLALKNKPPEAKEDPTAGVTMAAAAAWERGVKAEREQRWKDAEAAFDEAGKVDEKLLKAKKHYARALAAQHKLPEATAAFIAYLDRDPRDLDARFELAEVLRKRERIAEAFDMFSAYASDEKRDSRRAYIDHAKKVTRGLTRSFERRVVILPAVAEAGLDVGEVPKELKTRIDAKTNLDVVEASAVPLDALPKADAACRTKAACVWKPAWARWVVAASVVPPPEGVNVAVNLELFDVRAKKRIATAEVRSTGGNVLPLDIDDGLAVLMADLPPELAGTLKRREGGGGRRPLLLDDESAPPDEVEGEFSDDKVAKKTGKSESGGESEPAPAAEKAPAQATEASAASAGSERTAAAEPAAEAKSEQPKPSEKKRRLSDDDDDEPKKETRRVARAEVEAEKRGSIPIVPWVLIVSGVTVAGAGMAFDLLSPTSANYNVGVLDFVGPVALGLGAAAVVGGVILNPFGGGDDEK